VVSPVMIYLAEDSAPPVVTGPAAMTEEEKDSTRSVTEGLFVGKKEGCKEISGWNFNACRRLAWRCV
jgi:hypothetical protein